MRSDSPHESPKKKNHPNLEWSVGEFAAHRSECRAFLNSFVKAERMVLAWGVSHGETTRRNVSNSRRSGSLGERGALYVFFA